MKNISRVVLALVLSLMLVALPAGALAEDMYMAVITLTDPVVLMNDAPMMDMTGVEIDLTAGGNATGDKATLQAQVLGGSETALAALAELSDGQVVLTADGMDAKYTMSIEDVMGGGADAGAMDASSVAALVEEAQAIIMRMVEGGLIEELAEPITAFSQEIMASAKDEGTATYTMLSGDMEMSHMSFEVAPETFDNLFNSILTVLDNNADVRELLTLIAENTDSPELKDLALADLYAQAGVSQKVEADIYTSADGANMAMEMIQTVTNAQTEETMELHYRMLMEQPDMENMNMYMDVDTYEGGEATQGFYIAIRQTPSETLEDVEVSVEVGSGIYEDGEYVSQSEVLVNVVPEMLDGVLANRVTVQGSGVDESENFTANCIGYENEGKLYFDAAFEVEGMTITLNFDGQAKEEGGLTGVFTASFGPEGQAYGLKVNVDVSTAVMDSAEVLIGADGAIDINSMSSEEAESMNAQLGALVLNGVSVLDRNVPGLNGLMSMLMGGATE